MKPKTYDLNVLMDLCGGSLQAVRAVFPHYVLRDGPDGGLYLDRTAIAGALALPADRHSVYGTEPDKGLIKKLWRDAEEAGLTWHARGNLALPALPVPFTAHYLAAFMLAGGGRAIYEGFGVVRLRAGVPASEARGIDSGHFRLSASDIAKSLEKYCAADEQEWLDENAGEARKVMDEALGLLDLADKKFGREDKGVRDAANWLLEPDAPDEADAPTPSTEAAGPEPLATSHMAIAFDGLRYTAEQWKKPLGGNLKWVLACMVEGGSRGVRERRWNPVLLGAALVRDERASARSVRSRFQSRPLIIPWLDAWKTYEADKFETE